MQAKNGVDTLICNIVFIVVYLCICIAVGVDGEPYEPVHESSRLEENFNDCSQYSKRHHRSGWQYFSDLLFPGKNCCLSCITRVRFGWFTIVWEIYYMSLYDPDQGANRSFFSYKSEAFNYSHYYKIIIYHVRACIEFVFVHNAFYLILTFVETSRLGCQHRALFAEQIHERAFGCHNGCCCLERYGSIRSSCLHSEL